MLKMPSPRPHSFNYTSNCDGVAIVCFTSGTHFMVMVFFLSQMHKPTQTCSVLGTTGKPKGVMLGHSALIVQSLAKIATIGYNEDDVQIHILTLQLHVQNTTSNSFLEVILMFKCAGVFAYCSIRPRGWTIISFSHVNGRRMSCIDAQI